MIKNSEVVSYNDDLTAQQKSEKVTTALDHGTEGIQPEKEYINDKIEFGLTEIVSFSVADLVCAHNVIP